MNALKENYSKQISSLAASAKLPLSLSKKHINILSQFVGLFLKWNKSYSFSKFKTPGDIIRNLVFPSCAFSVYLQPNASVLDLGSGPGIPGIPLAIVRPDLSMHLVESSEKSFQFIHACKTSLSLDNVLGANIRAEELARDAKWKGVFNYVIARSFAPLPVVVEIAAAFNKVGGYTIVQVSKTNAGKLRSRAPDSTATGLWFNDVSTVDLSIDGVPPIELASFVKEHRCPVKYPRSWKKMKNRPLWK